MTSYPDLRGKKAVIFIGLQHHARKLGVVAEQLTAAGMQVLFITTANIPSLGEGNCECFELFLIKNRIPYRHLYQYRTPALRARINRDTQALARETARQLAKDNHDGLALFPPHLFQYSLADAMECRYLFRQMITTEAPDILMGLHEANFWVKLMAQVARPLNVPVLTFQEGFYTATEARGEKYAVMADYSTSALWGQEARDAVLKHAPHASSNIVLVGNPEYDFLFGLTHQEKNERRDSTRISLKIPPHARLCLLLLPNPYERYRSAIPINKLAEYIASLDHTLFWVKWHPRESSATIDPFRELEKDGRVKHIVSGDIKELLPACDLCMVLDSSAGLDAVIYEKPLLEINMGTAKFGRSYAQENVALLVDSPSKFSLVKECLEGKEPTYRPRDRDRYLERIFTKPFDKSGERIVSLVDTLIQNKK